MITDEDSPPGEVTPLPSDSVPNVKGARVVYQVMAYQGPLPPAAELERIHRLNPQYVERIIGMAEKQQEHHIKLETTVVQHQFRLKENGQAKALCFALAACTAGAVLTWLGHDWAGVAIGATPLAGIVGLFVTGKRTNDAQPSSGESAAEQKPEAPHEETDPPR